MKERKTKVTVMRLKIANPKDYEDRGFHNLISTMLEESYHDLIVYYQHHIITIEYDKEKRKYIYKMFELIQDHKTYVDVKEQPIIELNHDCHKYITYIIVHKMINEIYGLKGDFPMDTIEFQFVSDLTSFVFIEE